MIMTAPIPPVQAVSYLDCQLTWTESSVAGTTMAKLAIINKLDDARKTMSFSTRGAPFRDVGASGWHLESWTPTKIVYRASRGVATLDRQALTFTNHVIEHKNGLMIDQRGGGPCRLRVTPPAP